MCPKGKEMLLVFMSAVSMEQQMYWEKIRQKKKPA